MFARNPQRSRRKKNTGKKNKVNLYCLSLRAYFQMFGAHVCCIPSFFFNLQVTILQRPDLPSLHKPEVINWYGRVPLLGEVIKWFHQ